MSGLYFAHDPPRTYRDWKSSDYSFYDATARVLHDQGVLCEPDSREPWFVSAAHDDSCLTDTLAAFRGGDRCHAAQPRGSSRAGHRTVLRPGYRAGSGEHQRQTPRCDRRRRRPQRPGGGVLPGARRPRRAGARAQCRTSAARPSAASSTRISRTRIAPTCAACCGPRSSASSSCRVSACRSFRTTAAAR